jgi:hypothetical protein
MYWNEVSYLELVDLWVILKFTFHSEFLFSESKVIDSTEEVIKFFIGNPATILSELFKTWHT